LAIVPDRLPSNVTAETMAPINSCGELGGFVGSYFVGLLQAITGNPQDGYMPMSLAPILSGCPMLYLPEPRKPAHSG